VVARPLTILDDGEVTVTAEADGGRLWLDPTDFRQATGWDPKPEGLCRGTVCVPAPGASDGDRIDLVAASAALRRVVVTDDEHGLVAVAGAPMSQGLTGRLEDVTLPALDGGQLAFGDLLGRKTLVIAWASW
jgi:hypothetical protein